MSSLDILLEIESEWRLGTAPPTGEGCVRTRSSTYVRDDDGWQLVVHQQTPVEKPD